MDRSELGKTTARQLAQLITLPTGQTGGWRDEELADILECQLAVPILYDLEAVDLGWVESARKAAQAAQPGIVTLSDLLAHPRPPLDLLNIVKDFARDMRYDERGLLPAKLASLIYFLMIVLARRHHAANITELESEAIDQGVTWARRQRWVCDSVRAFLSES